jgi:hypothetical protein
MFFFRNPGSAPAERAGFSFSGHVADLPGRETGLHDRQVRVLPLWHSIFINTFFPNQFK